MISFRYLTFTALLTLAASFAGAAAEPLSFNRDIRPILSDCFHCHGPDEGSREGGLRLDLRDAALVGGKSGTAAIVPGKPGESELLMRVRSPHDDERMPPADKHAPLSADAIARLEHWIAAGAVYEPHWAFTPPRKAALASDGSAASPIDTLISARLARENLVLSPAAEPETLVRRLHLDLVGLPPTPAEIDAFVAAVRSSGDLKSAVAASVDRLLASPAFGEKWARHWLDVARYADSDGYEKDLPREQWAWRDWVVRAFNADLPYDRFIVEQVAGDLLIEPETDRARAQDLRVATGYLRNSMVNEEGAILAEEFRTEAMFDRMDALGKGVLGLTLQCAQCHTHKFDPITHEDYFRTFANLNNTHEAISAVYGPEKLKVIARIEREIAAVEDEVRNATPDWPQRLAAWGDNVRAAVEGWTLFRPEKVEWAGGVTHPQVIADGSVLTLGFRAPHGSLSFEGSPVLDGVTALRFEALTHRDLHFGGPGRSKDGLFAVSELIVEVRPPGAEKWERVEMSDASADVATATRPLPDFFRREGNDSRRLGGAAFLIDGEEETAWSPDRGPGRRNSPSEAVVRFKRSLNLPVGTRMRGTLRFKHAGSDIHGRSNQLLGRFRVSLSSVPEPRASPVPTGTRLALERPADERMPADDAALFAAWRAAQPEFAAQTGRIERLWAEFPERDTSILHLTERSRRESRETYRLDRGVWNKPKEPLAPGVPGFLHALNASDAPARLAFARWLVDPRSPTTARVAVNRVWQALFGAGLVETPEDFGIRARVPTHADLLDWLAVDFMENGWSHKRLIRTIVLSAAYQQTSRASPALRERDPANRLLARGPRFRLEAETIRDLALSVSGLLTQKLGGPGIFPPVPESLFATSFVPVTFWDVATGPERYRRSLYVFRRRSIPDPVLASFDAPTGETACVARPRSNTPLAALASLNEPVFVEAARALALRMLREGGATDAERIAFGFRLCTGRLPQPREIEELAALIRHARSQAAEGWLSAREFAFGVDGDVPELPASITPAIAAGWTAVARVLLNLDETLTKD